MTAFTCEHCGQPFTKPGKQRHYRYCSRKCSGEAYTASKAITEVRLCACGCGQELRKPDSVSWAHFRKARYIQGHYFTTQEHAEKSSAALLASHARGDFAHLKINPTPPKRGSEEHLAKLRPTQFKGPQFLTEEQRERRRVSLSKAKLGTHGCGRAARDNPDHIHARWWIIRSPLGKYYQVKNLTSWCRKNEELFRPSDDKPESRNPLWLRARCGFQDMKRNDRPTTSWKGWTLVGDAQNEMEVFGLPLQNTPILP